MNKFEQYTEGKTYKNKTDMVKDCFLHFKEITIRDMLISPFWINCPYSVMKSLKNHHDINFTKEDLIKDGKKVCEVYKLSELNKKTKDFNIVIKDDLSLQFPNFIKFVK